jgi:hypothetical protein
LWPTELLQDFSESPATANMTGLSIHPPGQLRMLLRPWEPLVELHLFRQVQSLNPTAWRTNSTLCSASSIQAMTDTSLVGRVLAIFGRGLGIHYTDSGTLGPTAQNIDQKIAQDNFQSHSQNFSLA